ncbi:MAG: hypothetical protein WAT58_03115 [Candidatus Dormiibacterota bacterium]
MKLRPKSTWASVTVIVSLLAALSTLTVAVPAQAGTVPTPSGSPSSSPFPDSTPSAASGVPTMVPSTPSPSSLATSSAAPKGPAVKPRQVASGTVVAQPPFALTTPSMVVHGFQYVGNFSLNTSTGTVTTMEFTATSADITGLGISLPCRSLPSGVSMKVNTGIAPSAVAHAPSGLQLFVTDIKFSSANSSLVAPAPPGPYAWTVASPPPGSHLLTGDIGTLTGLTATAVYLTAPSMVLPSYNQQASFC